VTRLLLLAPLLALLLGCTTGEPGTTPPAPSPSTSAPTPPPEQPTEPGGTLEPCPQEPLRRLTALTLNIHGGSTKAGDLALDRLADELRGWDADVVMLQEVDRGRERSGFADQAARLAARLGMEAAYGPTRRMRPGTTGNAVLTRFPVVDVARTALPREPGLYRRGLLGVTVRIAGQEVDLLSTHLDHVRPSARRAQAGAVAEAVVTSDRPTLLGGDLNTEPGFPPLQVLARAGLLDVWEEVGADEGHTVPAFDPRRRIDYLLADDSFAPVAGEVLLGAVSDHRAVRAELDLLPPAC
jgi:endonuclease/exonuclease/phosphatase family metal-dependent hydrolase